MKFLCNYILGVLLVVLAFVLDVETFRWIGIIGGALLILHTAFIDKCPLCGAKKSAA